MLAHMPDALKAAIAQLAGGAGRGGIAMGHLVDRLVTDGFGLESVESAIWQMLGDRELTPTGYVCRTLKIKDGARGPIERRCYEFMLVPWSAGLDQSDSTEPRPEHATAEPSTGKS